MTEKIIGVKPKNMFSLLAFAGIGLGLSLFAIDLEKVKDLLRVEYQETFDHLVNKSNEKDDVELAAKNLPDGTERILASWMNTELGEKRKAIAKGRIKPHHVMHYVMMAALELGGNRFKQL